MFDQHLAKLRLKLRGVLRERGGGFALPMREARTVPETVGERGGKEAEQHPRGAFAREQSEFEAEEMRGHDQFGFNLGATSSKAVHAPAAQRNSTSSPGVAARSAWAGGGGS